MSDRKIQVTLLASLVAVLLLTAFAGPVTAKEEGKASQEAVLRKALVKVHITRQGWQVYSPWKKNNPRSSWQRGVMVRSGYVLTTASALADNVMIEVSVANSARRYPASLAHLDYNANLALVKIDDYELGQTMEPIPLGDPITIDDTFEVWQIGSSELLERSTGHVQKVSPSGSQLRLTTKTNLTDSGYGQAVLKDGKLVGLVLRVTSSRQEGVFMAQETIKHYLADYDSGKYRGFGVGPLWYLKLLRDDFRDYFQVPEDVHGIAISRVLDGRTGHGVLEAGDVLAELSGYSLDDEGMFDHPRHGRLYFTYLLYGIPHPGDEVSAKIYRKGEAMDVKIPIRSWPADENPVPNAVRDRRPSYMVVGGLVLLELTRQHRGTFAISEYQNRTSWEPIKDRKRIVLLSRVLPDTSTKGLEDLGGDAITTVNGMKITELADIAEALKKPVDGYHVFELEGINENFVIKSDKLEEINKRISERYQITEMSYLGEDEGDGEAKKDEGKPDEEK